MLENENDYESFQIIFYDKKQHMLSRAARAKKIALVSKVDLIIDTSIILPYVISLNNGHTEKMKFQVAVLVIHLCR